MKKILCLLTVVLVSVCSVVVKGAIYTPFITKNTVTQIGIFTLDTLEEFVVNDVLFGGAAITPQGRSATRVCIQNPTAFSRTILFTIHDGSESKFVEVLFVLQQDQTVGALVLDAKHVSNATIATSCLDSLNTWNDAPSNYPVSTSFTNPGLGVFNLSYTINYPTTAPTAAPTITPTLSPTVVPTVTPTINPTVVPTSAPTRRTIVFQPFFPDTNNRAVLISNVFSLDDITILGAYYGGTGVSSQGLPSLLYCTSTQIDDPTYTTTQRTLIFTLVDGTKSKFVRTYFRITSGILSIASNVKSVYTNSATDATTCASANAGYASIGHIITNQADSHTDTGFNLYNLTITIPDTANVVLSVAPSIKPTRNPTVKPSISPTVKPSVVPTAQPSAVFSPYVSLTPTVLATGAGSTLNALTVTGAKFSGASMSAQGLNNLLICPSTLSGDSQTSTLRTYIFTIVDSGKSRFVRVYFSLSGGTVSVYGSTWVRQNADASAATSCAATMSVWQSSTLIAPSTSTTTGGFDVHSISYVLSP